MRTQTAQRQTTDPLFPTTEGWVSSSSGAGAALLLSFHRCRVCGVCVWERATDLCTLLFCVVMSPSIHRSYSKLCTSVDRRLGRALRRRTVATTTTTRRRPRHRHRIERTRSVVGRQSPRRSRGDAAHRRRPHGGASTSISKRLRIATVASTRSQWSGKRASARPCVFDERSGLLMVTISHRAPFDVCAQASVIHAETDPHVARSVALSYFGLSPALS